MKKSSVVLFCLRLFFYFSVIVLIFIHPGISVSFDRVGIIQWLVVIPLMAVTAFLPESIIKKRHKFIFSVVLLTALLLIMGVGFPGMLQPFAAGLISFAFTVLLFHRPPLFARFAKAAALEPFFLAWVCLRLLSLSRSGEEIAGQSIVFTQFILVWTAVVFLFHSVIIYLCLYPKSRVKAWKEAVVFSLGAFAALLVVLVVLPPDFVRNMVIENLDIQRIPQRMPQSDVDRGLPLRGSGRRTLPHGEGGHGELRGISEHNWPGRVGGAGENRQYMIKIVVADREPVYMGNSFRGLLDPVHGFLLSPLEPLNELARQRFFVTWFNNERSWDFGRARQEVFSLSTLSQKYLPYYPVVIDPVILNEDSGPLRYIHQVVSNTHIDDPLLLVHTPTRLLTEREKSELASYLEIPLYDSDKNELETYLNNALDMWRLNRSDIIRSNNYLRYIFSGRNGQNTEGGNLYLETIIALLVSFSDYQYNLVQDGNYSIAVLKDFLFNTKDGNCVEFSNTLALLGRLAGIPSRVVTGFVAAEDLQTPAHYRGLANLQSRIPFLQQFPFENLFMVTNVHSHSWTQFYIPGYGWLDFEATAFSIPPAGMGDFNTWDVVIPILDGNRTFSQVRQFPWQAVGRAAIALIIFVLICAYAIRYGREFALYIASQRGGRTGARSLYLLLLARLAADGQPIKPASKTAHEYSELFPKNITHKSPPESVEESHFKAFADIYSELRWRHFTNQAELDQRYQQLKLKYSKILNTTRRRGLHRWFIRLLSLRGLAYL